LAGWKKVVLDLKGTLFTGKLLPDPTALIVSVASDAAGSMAEPFLKVEGITNEFLQFDFHGQCHVSHERHGTKRHG
jgi:hypothetical protein